MRRAPIVLTATVVGTAGVLLFKPLPTSAVTAAGSGSDSGSSTSSDADPGGSGTASAPTGGSTADTGDASSASPSTGAAADGTWTGDAETVRWGTTQVKVTITDGKITDVAVLQENRNDSRSVQISENAFPALRSEVLSKQTAAVDTVSGATYTSAQYEASLQSALDEAGWKAPDGTTASTDVSTLQESGPGGGFGH